MPRKPRFNLPGIPQHVIQRGNNREPCFFTPADYPRYLDDLGRSINRFPCQLHAYVLMTNHVHLLVSTTQAYGISQMMQALGRRYVCYVNRRYKRSGTLWEGRFKTALIDSENYLLTCMRYIEMNTVRANIVDHPAKRQKAYRELFRQHMEDPLLDEIRQARESRTRVRLRVLQSSNRRPVESAGTAGSTWTTASYRQGKGCRVESEIINDNISQYCSLTPIF